ALHEIGCKPPAYNRSVPFFERHSHGNWQSLRCAQFFGVTAKAARKSLRTFQPPAAGGWRRDSTFPHAQSGSVLPDISPSAAGSVLSRRIEPKATRTAFDIAEIVLLLRFRAAHSQAGTVRPAPGYHARKPGNGFWAIVRAGDARQIFWQARIAVA